MIQREGSAQGVLETFCASAEVRVSRRNSKLSTGLIEGGGSCRVFLAENYASSLENNFFPFHAVLFCNCKTKQPASRENTGKKKPFLLVFFLFNNI